MRENVDDDAARIDRVAQEPTDSSQDSDPDR